MKIVKRLLLIVLIVAVLFLSLSALNVKDKLKFSIFYVEQDGITHYKDSCKTITANVLESDTILTFNVGYKLKQPEGDLKYTVQILPYSELDGDLIFSSGSSSFLYTSIENLNNAFNLQCAGNKFSITVKKDIALIDIVRDGFSKYVYLIMLEKDGNGSNFDNADLDKNTFVKIVVSNFGNTEKIEFLLKIKSSNIGYTVPMPADPLHCCPNCPPILTDASQKCCALCNRPIDPIVEKPFIY